MADHIRLAGDRPGPAPPRPACRRRTQTSDRGSRRISQSDHQVIRRPAGRSCSGAMTHAPTCDLKPSLSAVGIGLDRADHPRALTTIGSFRFVAFRHTL